MENVGVREQAPARRRSTRVLTAVGSAAVVTAVLGVAAFVAVLRIVPPSRIRAPGRVDVVGALGLTVGLLSVLLVVSKGNAWGWTSPLVLGLGVKPATDQV